MFQVVFPLTPFLLGTLIALYYGESVKDIGWKAILTVPEILFLGIVISASGVRDLQDVAEKENLTGFHEFIKWMLWLLSLLAMGLYGIAHDARIRSLPSHFENPDYLLPLLHTGAMIVCSAVCRFALIRIDQQLRSAER